MIGEIGCDFLGKMVEYKEINQHRGGCKGHEARKSIYNRDAVLKKGPRRTIPLFNTMLLRRQTVEDLRSESHVRRNKKVRRAIRGGRSRRTLECVAHTK